MTYEEKLELLGDKEDRAWKWLKNAQEGMDSTFLRIIDQCQRVRFALMMEDCCGHHEEKMFQDGWDGLLN